MPQFVRFSYRINKMNLPLTLEGGGLLLGWLSPKVDALWV